MENFNARFREAWFTDTGGVRAQRGNKLLYKTDIPASQSTKDYIFPVWIVANIKQTEDDKVWLDKVEVLNEYKNKERTELATDQSEEIAHKFQEHKAISENQ